MSLVLHSVEGLRGAGLVTNGDSGGGGCSLNAPPCSPALKWALSGLVIPRVNLPSPNGRAFSHLCGGEFCFTTSDVQNKTANTDNKYNNIWRFFSSIIRGNTNTRRIEKNEIFGPRPKYSQISAIWEGLTFKCITVNNIGRSWITSLVSYNEHGSRLHFSLFLSHFWGQMEF